MSNFKNQYLKLKTSGENKIHKVIEFDRALFPNIFFIWSSGHHSCYLYNSLTEEIYDFMCPDLRFMFDIEEFNELTGENKIIYNSLNRTFLVKKHQAVVMK